MAANISSEKIDLLIYGPIRPILENGFPDQFVVHRAESGEQLNGLAPDVKQKLRGMAVTYHTMHTGKAEMSQFPRLEMVASFGVGYDHIDCAYAREHNIVVSNTPDVLTEEVADVAMGLLIATLREFVKADKYLRSGLWQTASDRCATARSASSAWAASGRPLREGSKPRACPWSITRASPPPGFPISIIPT